ncbi:hypothetical protein RRG08_014048 [Elysia crispata]|uniref:Uncharacterized protein n=1 Tax=Elysia crispata TaxID=231223 RepID=A0AAE1A0S0_9GAST|nr:hypothetical protein RRG08_014048 [Elysia crispata]
MSVFTERNVFQSQPVGARVALSVRRQKPSGDGGVLSLELPHKSCWGGQNFLAPPPDRLGEACLAQSLPLSAAASCWL